MTPFAFEQKIIFFQRKRKLTGLLGASQTEPVWSFLVCKLLALQLVSHRAITTAIIGCAFAYTPNYFGIYLELPMGAMLFCVKTKKSSLRCP